MSNEQRRRTTTYQGTDKGQSKEKKSRTSYSDKKYSDKKNLTKGLPFSIKYL